MSKIFKRLEKIVPISTNCVFLASGCSSVVTQRGKGGAPGADGGQQRGAGHSTLGVGAIVGDQQRRGHQLLRTALHTRSISLENSLG